jgi:hypothetical protein
VGLERCPLSLVSTTDELLERKNSGSGLASREYGRGNPLRRPRDSLCPQTLALTSPTSGGRSVGIVRSRTKATEFIICCSNSHFTRIIINMERIETLLSSQNISANNYFKKLITY